jgi:hypothetical protein
MSLADGVPNEHAVIRDKAIKYIKENWGTLDGLPSDFIPVVWVTVFRALETGSQVPNSQVLLKDQLLNQGKLTLELKTAAAKLELLHTIIPQLRAQKDYQQRLADCCLIVDILRWNIHDAAELGLLERDRRRLTAKDDPLYRFQTPVEIWNRT